MSGGFDITNPEVASRLRDLLMPGLMSAIGRSGFVGDSALRVDERGIRVILNDDKTEVSRELATPAEALDGSFAGHFMPRLMLAFAEADRILSSPKEKEPA